MQLLTSRLWLRRTKLAKSLPAHQKIQSGAKTRFYHMKTALWQLLPAPGQVVIVQKHKLRLVEATFIRKINIIKDIRNRRTLFVVTQGGGLDLTHQQARIRKKFARSSAF